MNIAYHSSDLFAPVLGISIASVFENNKDSDDITIYVIENKITQDNQNRLRELADKYGRNVVFIPMPDINETEQLHLKKVKEKWIFDSYCRLFLDDLLPATVDKVLYLDSDVLVTDSLEQLWNTDLSDHVAAGVKDCFNKKYYDLLGLKECAHYCNSGVILINLKKWREERIGDQVRQYVHERNGYVFFMEQTVMNGVIQDKWLILPVKYNVNTLMMTLTYKEIQTLRKIDDFYSEKDVKEAVKQPVLIHMTSVFLIHNRAWIKENNHPAKSIYEKYKAMTPWKDADDLPDTRSKLVKVMDWIIDMIPNCVMLPLVSFMYNHIRVFNIRREMKKCFGGIGAGRI